MIAKTPPHRLRAWTPIIFAFTLALMPVVFAVMFAFFPAGLVLYWATNAGLSLAQQMYITRKIAAGDK